MANNLTIAKRITLMIAASLISLLIVGFVGLKVINDESASIEQIDSGSLEKILILTKARQTFMESRVGILARFIYTGSAEMDKLEKTLKTHAEKVEEGFKAYEAILTEEEDKKMLEADRQAIGNYYEYMIGTLLPAMRQTDQTRAIEIVKSKASALGNQTMKALNEHMTFNRKQSQATAKAAIASAKQGLLISGIVVVAAVTVIALMGILLLNAIKSSLKQIKEMVEVIEKNLDFTIRVKTSRRDEIDECTAALNRLLDKLQSNLKSIADGANNVASAANLMATTSTQVATASHEESESASGMAATVEEMTVSINHVADRAQETNQLVTDSGKLACSGEKVIGQATADIHDIATTVHEAAELIHGLEQHSQQISNVVQVIKDVAEQTNLLALNAAIEAARAGEQGRGFAVVADEVRKLAERTSASTQEISETINAMRISSGNAVSSMQGVVSKINQGVERAQEANSSIQQIGESSRYAVEIVGEIAEAIREQGSATNNIATQVERIAQMSEESSAAAANSAQATSDLDRIAKGVQTIISAYKL